MTLLALYSNIKSHFPAQGRDLFTSFLSTEPELATILASFELYNQYSFNPTVVATKNTEQYTILEALGRVCYWLVNSDHISARREFRSLPTQQQQVLSYIFGGTFYKSLGRDFLLDSLPKLYTLSELYSSFIKLPEKLDATLVEHLEGVSRNLKVTDLTLPIIALNIPKSSRKSSKLFYIVKRGNTIHSNLSNKEVRQYFKDIFNYETFGCIFLYSKVNKKRFGKHIIPICISKDYSSILKLYKGGVEVNLDSIDFDTRKYFTKITSNYIELKYPNIQYIYDNTQLNYTLPKLHENNYLISSNGIIKIKFDTKTRFEKVSDFILNSDYIPIGLMLADGSKYYMSINEEFVDGGLENRYVTIYETVLGDKVVRSNIYDIKGAGLFKCKCCGAISKTNLKGLCSMCYSKLRSISEFTNDSEIILEAVGCESFNISINKYDINGGNGKLVFSIQYDNIKGKQLSLPFQEYC